jgi:hypothetical protein
MNEGLRSTAVWIEKQAVIAGVHHAEPEAYQADRAITQIVTCAAAFQLVVETEENPSDFAVACALLPPVEGAEGKDEPVSTSLRQRGGIWPGIAAGQPSPESDRGGYADLEKLVEWQEDGGGLYAGFVEVDTKHGAITFDEVFRTVHHVAGI